MSSMNIVSDEKSRTIRPDCFSRLQNMKDLGFSPKVILDGGASVGYWAWQAHKMFMQARIVSIEPNPLIIGKLEDMVQKIKNESLALMYALGKENGKAVLNIWDNEETKMSGSSLKDHVQGPPKKSIEVDLKTIDAICEENSIKPDLLKLDLQGGELDALKGATNILKSVELVIIEFGVLEAYINRTTPYDLMEYFYKRDFILYDIVDLLYRPFDNALTGGDFFFIPKNSSLRSHKGYL